MNQRIARVLVGIVMGVASEAVYSAESPTTGATMPEAHLRWGRIPAGASEDGPASARQEGKSERPNTKHLSIGEVCCIDYRVKTIPTSETWVTVRGTVARTTKDEIILTEAIAWVTLPPALSFYNDASVGWEEVYLYLKLPLPKNKAKSLRSLTSVERSNYVKDLARLRETYARLPRKRGISDKQNKEEELQRELHQIERMKKRLQREFASKYEYLTKGD